MLSPALFSLTPLQQVLAYWAVIGLATLISRGNSGSISIAALWAAILWMGGVFLKGFAPEVSLWAPFVMVPYFLLGFAFYGLVIVILERYWNSTLGEGSLIMLAVPMLFFPLALFYFPAQLLVWLWRTFIA